MKFPKVEEWLKQNHPVALDFLYKYTDYINRIDDIVDKDKEYDGTHFVIETFARASDVYNHEFFHKNRDLLIVLDQIIANTYRDSEMLKLSEKGKNREAADHLRHCGYNMTLAVILLVGGRDKLNEFSLEIRQKCHNS